MAKYDPRLKMFVRLDAKNYPTSQIVLRKNKPKVGKWRELNAESDCCTTTSSTSTTTTSSTTTTTTTGA